MIVEHSFVTTLEPERAFAMAEELLASLRFHPESMPAPLTPAADNGQASSPGTRHSAPGTQHAARSTQHAPAASRSWRRGAKRPSRSRGHGDIPTRVRMDFDRGRVVVAASVEAPGNVPRLPRQLAVGITLALERMLALGQSTDEARSDCDRYHARMASGDQLRSAILLSLIGLTVVGIVALIAFSPFR